MKKIITACVIFILTASSIFAQDFRFGGRAWTRSFIAGSTIDPDESFSFDQIGTNAEWRVNFFVSLQNEAGTAGVRGCIETEWNTRYLDMTNPSISFGPVAWAMITPEIYLALGNVNSGRHNFTGTYIAGWGLNATGTRTSDFGFAGGIINESSSFWWYNGFAGTVLPNTTGFYMGATEGNSGMEGDLTPGLRITLFPLGWFGITTRNQFRINYFAPLRGAGEGAGTPRSIRESFWEHMDLQVVYNIHDVGELAVTLQNNTRIGGVSPQAAAFLDPLKNIYVQWRMNALGFAWEFGVHYTYSPAGWPRMPLRLGIGWGWGNFWIDDRIVLTSRLGLAIPMDDYTREFPATGFLRHHQISSAATPGVMPIIGQEFRLGWDFVFNMRVAPGLRFYAPVGIGLMTDDDGVLFGWHFSPYIVRRITGGFEIYAGVTVFNGDGSPGWPPLAQLTNGGLTRENEGIIHWAATVALFWRF